MYRRVSRVILLIFLCSAATNAIAGPIVGPSVVLTSSDDLTQILVGDQVHITVTLQGVDVGNNFIFVLNTKVLFPDAVFDVVPDPGTSSGLTPGPILETAAQVASFDAVSSLGGGAAVGNFSDSSPSPSQAIAQNGVYYSFILVARALGSGVIEFDTANTTYAANSTDFNLAPLPTGGALAFKVVPEPASLSLACIGLLAGLATFRLRHRTR